MDFVAASGITLPTWPNPVTVTQACAKHKIDVDAESVGRLALKIRDTLNAIKHRPKDMPMPAGTPRGATSDGQCAVIRNDLIIQAAITLEASHTRLRAIPENSALLKYLPKAETNIRNFEKYGMTGQIWGTIMLRSPRTIEAAPKTLLDNFEGMATKLRPYGFDASTMLRICEIEPELLTRNPDTTLRRFEWMLAIKEVTASRSRDDVNCDQFKKQFAANVMRNTRGLTCAEDNFFLRLVALELRCIDDATTRGASRPTVESAIVAALGHNPNDKIIRSAHIANANEAKEEAKFFEEQLEVYAADLCEYGRERWKLGAMPRDMTISKSPSALFLPGADCPPKTREHKQQLLHGMARAGVFEHYRLATLDS